jgi:galactokinase
MNLSTTKQLREHFEAQYGSSASPRLFRAPGRVNLIGEHTDYNDGFVLPMAIDRSTWVAASPRTDRRIVVMSLDVDDTGEIDLDGTPHPLAGRWWSYIEGVARELEADGYRLPGANLVIASDVPQGAGLSSSAALEMSVGVSLLSLSGREFDRTRLALAGQRAEHTYVGTKCGIMDQFISAKARAEHALLIDCRSLEATPVPLPFGDHALLVLDTGVRHQLASSEYNQRRAECEEGVRLLAQHVPGIRALRDVTPELLDRFGAELPVRIRRRCRHVVHENARTLAAVDALRTGELKRFGELMRASHDSLRDDYEVSCPELDLLVDSATRHPAVIGARMTGGGFGGSAIALVARGALDEVASEVSERYEQRFGRKAAALVTGAAAGASESEG